MSLPLLNSVYGNDLMGEKIENRLSANVRCWFVLNKVTVVEMLTS